MSPPPTGQMAGGAKAPCAYQLSPVVWWLGTAWLLFCGVKLMADILPGGSPKSGSARADGSKGLDHQSQLGHLSGCPDHVPGLEGLPGPQT